jgi:hypothetical protein
LEREKLLLDIAAELEIPAGRIFETTIQHMGSYLNNNCTLTENEIRTYMLGFYHGLVDSYLSAWLLANS